jgi:hypothetical protein
MAKNHPFSFSRISVNTPSLEYEETYPDITGSIRE